MFRTSREVLIGQSFQVLYPTPDEFERIGQRIAPILGASDRIYRARLMKTFKAATTPELVQKLLAG